MRIMLDSNVVISIVVFNSKNLKKMLEIIIEKYKLVLSSYVLDELKEVVKRKFKNKLSDLDEFLYNLPFEIYYTPETIINKNLAEIRDIKDAPVLYSSIMSDVDILITGDKDFDNLDIEKPEILSPSQFLEKYS